MSSFYGGKQGRTYHIVARYDCVNLDYFSKSNFIIFEDGVSYEKGAKIQYNGEYYIVLDTISTSTELTNEDKVYHIRGMVQLFQKGGAYTEANYGEYVLIDTIFGLNHKDDPENGLLYRRGFDYNLTLKDKPNIEEKNDNDLLIYYDENNNLKKNLWKSAWDAWIQKPGAGAIYVGQIVGSKGDTPEIILEKWNNDFAIKSVEGSFSKGKDTIDGQVVYNDEIRVGSQTGRDDDGNITGAKIAFDIPQTVFDAPNINLNLENITYKGAAEEDDSSKNHPFYYKWNFNIPQVTDFNIETGSQLSPYTEDGYEQSINQNDEYLTYKVHNAGAAGVVLEHLGRWPYRVIDDISVFSNNRNFINIESGVIAKIGDLYSFGDIQFSDEKIICAVCIEEGIVDPESLPVIKPDDTLETILYVLGFLSWSGYSKWRVIEIPSTAPASSMIIDYKAGENTLFTDKLRNVDFLTVDNKGDLYVKYSDKPEEKFYLTNINGLESVFLDDDGINIIYTNGSTSFFEIKQIDSIKLLNQDNILQSQYFTVKYKNGTIKNISDNLNTILAVDMYGDNIIVLYSDPDYRNNFESTARENIDYYKKNWTDPVTGTFYENLVWINLSSTKGSYHVEGEYTYEDLRTTLANGFGNVQGMEDRIGWLVTVQDDNTKKIFAFDNNDDTQNGKHLIGPEGNKFNSHWYEIFSLAASAILPTYTVTISDSNDSSTGLDTLNTNGFWFVTYSGHDDI